MSCFDLLYILYFSMHLVQARPTVEFWATVSFVDTRALELG